MVEVVVFCHSPLLCYTPPRYAKMRDEESLLLGLFVFISLFVIFLVIGANRDFISNNSTSIIELIKWSTIATCSITFSYITFHLYTKIVFRNRQELVTTVLAISTYIVYTVSLIQIIWFSYNWYSGVGDDPMMFSQLVVADFAMFSIITKRKAKARRQRATAGTTVDPFYLSCLLSSALVFRRLRFCVDTDQWMVVTSIVSSCFVYGGLWASPLIFEWFLLHSGGS